MTIRHHAIIITAETQYTADQLRHSAINYFHPDQVSELTFSPDQSTFTFTVGPDGEPEGTYASDQGDTRREDFLALVAGTDNVDFVELAYGNRDASDAFDAKIERTSSRFS